MSCSSASASLALGAADEPVARAGARSAASASARAARMRSISSRLLDRAQPLDDAARADQLDPVGQQLAQPAVLAHATCARPRTRAAAGPAASALARPPRADPARRGSRSNDGCDLLGRLLDVAEVGDEGARARARQRQAVAAGEAGQIADVDEVGDQQRVDARASGSAATSRSARASHASQLLAQRSQRVPVAVRALARPPVPTHSSRITEWRRHSSRESTSERCTSTAGQARSARARRGSPRSSGSRRRG